MWSDNKELRKKLTRELVKLNITIEYTQHILRKELGHGLTHDEIRNIRKEREVIGRGNDNPFQIIDAINIIKEFWKDNYYTLLNEFIKLKK